MELAVPNFVISQNPFQELREDALPAFKEQLIVRRRGDHDDVAALLRLITEIPCDDIIDYVHGLRSAAKADYSWIGFARVVVLWEHNLVVHRRSSDIHALVESIGSDRNGRYDHKDRHKPQDRASVLSHIVLSWFPMFTEPA